MEFDPSGTIAGLRGTAQQEYEISKIDNIAALAVGEDLGLGKSICRGNLSPSHDGMPTHSLWSNSNSLKKLSWTMVLDLRVAWEMLHPTGLADKTRIKSKPYIEKPMKGVERSNLIYQNCKTGEVRSRHLKLWNKKEERELGN